jgi:hypothetical protein
MSFDRRLRAPVEAAAALDRAAGSLRWLARLLLITALASAPGACSTAYYAALEQVGIEKREVFSHRIENAREAQTDARDQFAAALVTYRNVVDFDGGEIEAAYEQLDAEFERTSARAETVRERIESVEQVAAALFAEWEQEIEEYSNADLRRRSRTLLGDTRTEYQGVLAAMQQASAAMDPVLALFRDQVLFLRHNLNAAAIGALDDQRDDIERATRALIAEMERAIDEASQFIETLG